MMVKSFKELAERAQAMASKTRIALACAHDRHSLEAVATARRDGIAESVLIGHSKEIKEILDELGESVSDYELISCGGIAQSIKTAAELVRGGDAGIVMKGKMETSDIMRGILNHESGLRTDRSLSVTGIFEIKAYHKILGASDVAIAPYPDLQGKVSILTNAVDLFHALGHDCPKVAVLAAVEKVNPKMPETVEADELKQMNLRGELPGCV
ncbi:MAG: phosphate butyryltransferase, partial [Synergistaceae bacterium]|nr:phosphate butyryltransferase [Synergistaceae bacterium]